MRARRSGTPTVWVRGHDGQRSGATLPVQDGAFRIDGTVSPTPWYEIDYRAADR